jgi:hypothetical protein
MSNNETYYAEGFDECIIGIDTQGDVPRIVYDKWDMVTTYLKREPDCTWDEAVEWMEFNVWYAGYGPGTPIYLRTVTGTVEEKISYIEEFIDTYMD